MKQVLECPCMLRVSALTLVLAICGCSRPDANGYRLPSKSAAEPTKSTAPMVKPAAEAVVAHAAPDAAPPPKSEPRKSAPEPAAAPAQVAVVAPLHVGSTDPGERQLGESLGEVLAVALADQKNLVVVERQKLRNVLDEQKLSVSGLVDPATAAKVGKLLLADLVVAGSIVETGGGKFHYAVYVIAVDGQRILGSVQMDGPRSDVERISMELAPKVAALSGTKLPPIKPEELDDSPVGRLHLMRGISLYYANNDDRAIMNCLKAVQLDPRLQEARLWIAKAYLRQGEKEHARIELTRLARNPAAKPFLNEVNQLLAKCGPAPRDVQPAKPLKK